MKLAVASGREWQETGLCADGKQMCGLAMGDGTANRRSIVKQESATGLGRTEDQLPIGSWRRARTRRDVLAVGPSLVRRSITRGSGAPASVARSIPAWRCWAALAVVLVVPLLLGSNLPARAASLPQSSAGMTPSAEGVAGRDRLVIAVADGDVEQLLDDVEEAAGAMATVVANVSGGFVLEFDDSIGPGEFDAAVVAAKSSEDVEFAERDEWREPVLAPNDPLYSSTWALSSIYGSARAEGIGVEDAWAVTMGSSNVVVAVIDTGILPHPDIADRLSPGADMISSPNISQDGDGRDGDNTDEGDTCGGNPSSWHGLHVAGTIGASTNNGIGTAGIDRRSRVISVRALGTCGGWVSDIADAIRWSAGLPVPGVATNPTPAKVINLSLGGAGACTSIERSAIDAAVSAGTVVVAAAGNSDSDLDLMPFSPASCNNVIAVAATTRFGDRANYSNFGSIVDVAAPGGLKLTSDSEAILSLSNAGTATADLTSAGWTYSYKQGTSMAAPYVSGVVSLMLAANSILSPAQVEQILKQTARPFPLSPRGAQFSCSSDPAALYHCGAGLLDAGAAVRAADALVTAPSPPGALSVATGSGAARMTWAEPNSGGSAITGYTVTVSPGGRTCTWTSGPLTCTIAGLAKGQPYTAAVVAQNRKSAGSPAVSAPFTWWPTYNPVAAARLFDTRSGVTGGLVGVAAGRVVPGSPLSVGLSGVGGVPSTGVGGLSLNVTVVGASEPGFLTVFACGGAVPGVSSVNFGIGEAGANAVIVPSGVDGRVCFDASTPVQVIVDINGWFAQGQGFNPVAASRLLDTRSGSDVVRAGRVVPGTPLSMGSSGVGGVPSSGVGGLSLNVTVVGASEPGFLTVFACGGAVPGVSSVNFGVGEAVANAVIVPPGVDSRVCFDASTPVQVIVDINGWFRQGQGFNQVPAARLFDTRTGSDVVAAGRVVPGSPLSVGTTGVGGVPSWGVGGLSLNVTVVGASAPGFLTVVACGATVPLVSSVNFGAGEAVANAVIVPPGVDGRVCFDTSTPVQVIADVNGWFASDEPVR